MCVLVCLSSQHCNVVIPNLIFDLWVSGGYLLIYLRDIKINIMEREGNLQGDLGNQQGVTVLKLQQLALNFPFAALQDVGHFISGCQNKKRNSESVKTAY